MIPSIHEINYQLPPENKACAYAPMLFWGREQGGVEVMQGTAQRSGCHQILLGKMIKDPVETEFVGDLTKYTHYNLSNKKHFNEV